MDYYYEDGPRQAEFTRVDMATASEPNPARTAGSQRKLA